MQTRFRTLLLAAALLNHGALFFSVAFAGQLDSSPQESVPSRSFQRRFVHSIEDFEVHMKHHIQRVEILGMRLLKFPDGLNPDEIRKMDPVLVKRLQDKLEKIDRVLLQKYLKLHDQSKVNATPEFLAHYGFRPDEPKIIERLYGIYGKNRDNMRSDEVIRSKTLIDKINAIDRQIGYEFFSAHDMIDSRGNSSFMARIMMMVEKIADGVDRGMSPVSPEEFNRTMKLASEFLTDPEEIHLSLYLENRYPTMFEGRALRKEGREQRIWNDCIHPVLHRILVPALQMVQ